MSKLVTVFGGSGFIGRYAVQRLARDGWRVRVAVRRPNEALFVKVYGHVGQIEPVFCDIRDADSVRAVLTGAEAAVNCVGTFNWRGDADFEAIQHQGAANVAQVAAELGVKRLIHLSAVGADAASESGYARSKALGEEAVRAAFPEAVILRPSVVYGYEDKFFNRFAAMARLMPVLMVPGADTRFQPVYVDDVAAAIERGVLGQAAPGTYELGGPDVATLRELLQIMLRVIRRRRLVVGMPMWMARFMAFWFDLIQVITGGLIASPLTRDQVRMLARDNVVSPGARGFAELGLEPRHMGAILPQYLFRYRPNGQYEAITASARGMRG